MRAHFTKRALNLSLLLLLVSACGPQTIPSPAAPTPGLEQTLNALILTLTAQAGATTAAPDASATATVSPPAIDTPTETPTVSVPDTSSPTPATPMAGVSAETNCRTGPSKYYKFIAKVDPGARFVIIGKHSPTGYWIIKLDNGQECWLWGQNALVEGDLNSLPEYTQPAVGRLEGEVRASASADANRVDHAFVSIGLSNFNVYETRADGFFVFEDVPAGEVKIVVQHSFLTFPTSVRAIVQIGGLAQVRINALPPIIIITPPDNSSPCPPLQRNCIPLPTQGPVLP